MCVKFDDLSEKECQHSGFVKKSEAEKARDNVLTMLNKKRYVIYKNVKVQELLVYWLEREIRCRPDSNANTYLTYKYCIEKHIIPEIGKVKLISLNQSHILKMYKNW